MWASEKNRMLSLRGLVLVKESARKKSGRTVMLCHICSPTTRMCLCFGPTSSSSSFCKTHALRAWEKCSSPSAPLPLPMKMCTWGQEKILAEGEDSCLIHIFFFSLLSVWGGWLCHLCTAISCFNSVAHKCTKNCNWALMYPISGAVAAVFKLLALV